MPELRCPCGQLVGGHNQNGCLLRGCNCNLTEAQALRAAQRKAAALNLVRLRRARDTWRNIGHIENHFESVAHIAGAWLAYRAVGILGRK